MTLSADVQAWSSAWIQAVAKAWTDPAYRHRLLHDPRGGLLDFHYHLPPNIDLHVIDYTAPHGPPTRADAIDLEAFDTSLPHPPHLILHLPLLPPPADLADGMLDLFRPNSYCGPGDCACACI